MDRDVEQQTLTLASPAAPDAVRAFVAAQLAGDRQRALRLLDAELASGRDALALQTGLIALAQAEIGRLWQENRITVAQEHLATGIAQLALATLYPRIERRKPTGRRAVVACVEGELHDLGPRIVADHLEAEGWDVRFLGASVPTEGLIGLCAALRPELIVLSCTLAFNLPALAAAVAGVRTALPSTCVAAGGRAVGEDPALAERLSSDLCGCVVTDLLAGARTRFQAEATNDG